ncbi:MAG: PIN domain-containing protein [Balneola sp.]
MSKYKVLIDSSVWIEYFKNGAPSEVDFLINENLASTNDLILSEILPILIKNNEKDAIEGLRSIENIPLQIDWELIQEYQVLNLKNGLDQIGIPDLIIIQQVIQEKLSLLSLDKHFKLMREFLSYELFETNT